MSCIGVRATAATKKSNGSPDLSSFVGPPPARKYPAAPTPHRRAELLAMNRDPSRSVGLNLSRRGVLLTSLAFAGAAAVRVPARAAPVARDAAAQLAALARADKGLERRDRRVPYRKTDLLDYAPVTKAHVAEGGMTVEALCAAAVQESDNTAAILLLRQLGGNPPLPHFVRGQGDSVSRFDRPEPFLNRARGILDTTTPRGAAAGLRTLLLGDALSPASRAKLWGWMETSTPGTHRLRAGLPADWRIAHKTGTSGQGQSNDISVIRPPRGAPLIVTAYYLAPQLSDDRRDAVIAEAARIVARWRS